MKNYIRKIEELSFNAWPSHKSELYDSWIIRYSHNYTHRTNCVNIVGNSRVNISEKIAYCEKQYRLKNTPCIFKISPLIDRNIDKFLEDYGYIKEHTTKNLIMQLSNYIPWDNNIHVNLNDTLEDKWIHNLFSLNQTTDPKLLNIVPLMYKAIPKPIISASIYIDDKMIASGLAIIDRDYAGIYAIYVDKNYRRHHFAKAICNALLTELKKGDTKYVYLQVVDGNTPACFLYEKLGFKYLYTYWFRTKYVL